MDVFWRAYHNACVIILYNNLCLSDNVVLTESVHRQVTSVSYRLLEKNKLKVI